tara:strand:- start:59 stop:352 length:294 start_codon:yes stop_codon:yes gene_type:complete
MLRPFKREYQGYINATDTGSFTVLHDEVPLGTPLGKAMHHIAKDAVKHGATESVLNIDFMFMFRAYRLFGIRITPWLVAYDFDPEDEEETDPHFMLL